MITLDGIKYEEIVFTPVLKDSTDLEAATKTITALSEAVGIGSADYSWTMTGANSIPSDPRIVIIRRAFRFLTHIDSFNTANHLYCRVYMDSQDANHMLFDVDLTNAASDNIAVLDAMIAKYSGSTAQQTILAAINDGLSHTFYFFYWINVAGNAVISVVNLWQGIGCINQPQGYRVIQLNYTGLVQFGAVYLELGGGSASCQLLPGGNASGIGGAVILSYNYTQSGQNTPGMVHITLKVGTAGDLAYFTGLYFWLRNN